MIGVIDLNRSKEKGYETLVKDSFCGEVRKLHFKEAKFKYYNLYLPHCYSLVTLLMQLDELRQIYEELPGFLEEVIYFLLIMSVRM